MPDPPSVIGRLAEIQGFGTCTALTTKLSLTAQQALYGLRTTPPNGLNTQTAVQGVLYSDFISRSTQTEATIEYLHRTIDPKWLLQISKNCKMLC